MDVCVILMCMLESCIELERPHLIRLAGRVDDGFFVVFWVYFKCFKFDWFRVGFSLFQLGVGLSDFSKRNSKYFFIEKTVLLNIIEMYICHMYIKKGKMYIRHVIIDFFTIIVLKYGFFVFLPPVSDWIRLWIFLVRILFLLTCVCFWLMTFLFCGIRFGFRVCI